MNWISSPSALHRAVTIGGRTLVFKYAPVEWIMYPNFPFELSATDPARTNDMAEVIASPTMDFTRKPGPQHGDSSKWNGLLFCHLESLWGPPPHWLSRDPKDPEYMGRWFVKEWLVSHLSSDFGIVSLSHTNPAYNPSMWGYYAGRGDGMAIGYDLDLLRSLGCVVKPVIYDDEKSAYLSLDVEGKGPVLAGFRPRGAAGLPAEIRLTPDSRESLARLFLTRKHVSWQYEREVRILVPTHRTRLKVAPTGERAKVLDIPPDAVRSVFLGLRMAQEHRNLVLGRLPTRMKASASHLLPLAKEWARDGDDLLDTREDAPVPTLD